VTNLNSAEREKKLNFGAEIVLKSYRLWVVLIPNMCCFIFFIHLIQDRNIELVFYLRALVTRYFEDLK